MKRTHIYIDGFNLYYGSLKGTPYKWLDLKLLFKNILDASHDITAIKYYTARIAPRDNNQDSVTRQQIYLRAIQSFIPELSIYLGHYLTHAVTLPRINHDKKITEFVRVLKTEEKGSDVNLALHALNDAWLNEYDCAIIVSNDSDLAESLRLIKHHHKKVIGLITPGDPKIRKPSKMLSQYADFTKPIRKGVLAASQLPDIIPGTNLTKPDDWK